MSVVSQSMMVFPTSCPQSLHDNQAACSVLDYRSSPGIFAEATLCSWDYGSVGSTTANKFSVNVIYTLVFGETSLV